MSSSSKRQPALGPVVLRSIAVALLGGALLAPFVAVGCAPTKACIQWDASRGACPSRAEALATMQSSCGPVISVDSDAERVEGDALCCYEVTEASSLDDVACAPPPLPETVGSGPKPPIICGGLFSGACAVCVGSATCAACAESNCCGIVEKCAQTDGCPMCQFDPSSCSNNVAGGLVSDELVACLWTSCPKECFGRERQAPACDAFTPGASGGSCFTVDAQTSFCNPVEPSECMLPGACDVAQDGTIQCISRPTSENVACSPCGATGWCNAGFTCLDGFCARFCCDDSDCGSGHCDPELPANIAGPLGLCVEGAAGAGGAGAGGAGAGGAGGAGGTGGQGG